MTRSARAVSASGTRLRSSSTVRYASAEHYMMAAKARLFDDSGCSSASWRRAAQARRRPSAAKSPASTRHAGTPERVGIVIEGNLGKFGQNASLKKYLLGTADRVLVEASPVDAIWGIGLAASDPLAAEPATWQGLNLLGFALMEVRRRLAQ